MSNRDEKNSQSMDRRSILKSGAAIGAGVAAAAALPGEALANRHPHPNPGSQTSLDRNMYTSNVEVVEHFTFKSSGGDNEVRTAGKAQIQAIGNRRYMFQGGNVYDVTEPRKMTLINERGFQGGQLQLAYNRALKKWLLVTGSGAPNSSTSLEAPRGKWDDPSLIDRAVKWKGLRGVRIYDATNPEKIDLLSEWSCDQGDPKREIQEGQGTHRNFYGGGRYAYLDTAPDNSFTHMESGVRPYTFCIQTVDLADPAKPKFVSNWWIPGQRENEMEEYRKWRQYGDKTSWTCTHGPCVVPQNIEDGGKYGYTAYGAFGMTIHDMSDPKNPKLVGKFDPLAQPGGIPFHTVDPVRLDRGIVTTNPETLNPDCNQPWQDSYVVDVRDPTNPKAIARFPIPTPPPNAPYDTFCNKRGRFGTHNPPHSHAPGPVNPNVAMFSCFNAGVQLYDIANLIAPKSIGYFIPPQGGALDEEYSFNRDTDNVLVEWDRNIIYALTNTGIYLLSAPALGKPVFDAMPVKAWALPHLNRGHDSLRA